MTWGAVAGSIIGGAIAGSSAEDAEDAQYAAQQEANRRADRGYERGRADYKPFLESEKRALAELNALYGLDYTDYNSFDEGKYNEALAKDQAWASEYDRIIKSFYGSSARASDIVAYANRKTTENLGYGKPGAVNKDDYYAAAKGGGAENTALARLISSPGYQFGLGEGINAIGAGASSRGNVFSGRTLKDLTRFGQDYASTKFGERANQLSNMAGRGTVRDLATLGANYDNNYNNNALAMANASAAARIAQGNAFGSTLAGLGRIYANRSGGYTNEDDYRSSDRNNAGGYNYPWD